LKEYQELSDFVFSILSDKSFFKKFKPNEGFLITILILTKKMFKLGFFNTHEQFTKLFRCLKDMLVYTDGILLGIETENIDYEKVNVSKLKFAEIILPPIIFKIKITVLKIINIMLLVQNDIKID
jgi:hypothetical protein